MFFRDKNNKCPKEIDAIQLQENTVTDAFNGTTWYCQQQTPTPFQKDMDKVVSHYKIDKNTVVIKHCGSLPDGNTECVGFLRGSLPKGETNAKFIVKPRRLPGIFARKTNYWILDLTKDSMIISAGNPTLVNDQCTRKPEVGQGLWIVTKERARNDALVNNALDKLKNMGIDCSDMKVIKQN